MVKNWENAIQDIRDFADDSLEFRNKIEEFITGEDDSGEKLSEVTFDFSDGSSKTVDTLDIIASKAGGSFNFSAKEAISYGQPVTIDEDGKARSVYAPETFISYTYSSDAYGKSAICHDSDRDEMIVVYYDNTDNKIKAKIADSDTTPTFTDEITIAENQTTSTNIDVYHASGDSCDSVIVIFYIDVNDSDKMKYKVAINNGETLQLSSAYTVGSQTDVSAFFVKYDDENNEFVNLHWDNLAYNLYINSGEVDGTAKTVNFNTSLLVFSGSSGDSGFSLTIDKENQHSYVTYKDTSDDFYVRRVTGYSSVAQTTYNLYSLVSGTNLTILDTYFNENTGRLNYIATYSWNNSILFLDVYYDYSIFEYAMEYKRQTIGSYSPAMTNYEFATFDMTEEKIFLMGGVAGSAFSLFWEYDIKSDEIVLNNYWAESNESKTEASGETSNQTFYTDSGIVHYIMKTSVGARRMDERPDFFGIAQNNASVDETVTVSSVGGGVDKTQSDLVPGKRYYLTSDIKLSDKETNTLVGIASKTDELKLL